MTPVVLTRVASYVVVPPQDLLHAKIERQTPLLKIKAKTQSRVRTLMFIFNRGAGSLLISGRQEEQCIIINDVNR